MNPGPRRRYSGERMPISREEAFRVATDYVHRGLGGAPDQMFESGERVHLRSVREVLAGNEVSRPPTVYGLRVPIEECWIAYLYSGRTGIYSSDVVIVSKEDGQVLYSGSAGDEG
jgi:hypothetical protein